jgi:hypothetical protein
MKALRKRLRGIRIGSNFLALHCLAFLLIVQSACSVPILETSECIAARPEIREFYSFHFGNDQKFSPEDLELRANYLAPEFAGRLRNAAPETDPFTLTADTPRAFRLAECRTVEPERKVSFDVQLFWKTDERSDQRTVKAEAIKQNDKWLVNAVTAN